VLPLTQESEALKRLEIEIEDRRGVAEGRQPGAGAMKLNDKSVPSRDLAHVQDIVRQVAGIVRSVTGDPSFQVRLFGSWAAGNARPRSDIDIAIDGPRPVDPVQMADVRDACDRLHTLFTVDLVDLASAGAEFREAVRRQTGLVKP
jgi:predicted nucleotidyltransferase